jgi:copper(I)-binding protein
MKRRSLIALGLFWPISALAHSARAGDIGIGHAWALPSGASFDGQVFMPLLNQGKIADALIAARCDVAAFIELRRNARYDDPAESQFDLLPMKPVAMRPAGPHLRLVSLGAPLTVGQRFSLILDFLNAGETEVEVHVENTPGT